MTIWRGIVLLWTGGSMVQDLHSQAFLFVGRGSILGIPFPVILMFLLIALGSYLMGRTYLGREIYAIGNNPVSSRVSGIKVKKVLLSVYILVKVMNYLHVVIGSMWCKAP
jgi:ribose/xylose/arabinose/galactoside ABC-type transport system permease subunit